jgi:hypothetical protein
MRDHIKEEAHAYDSHSYFFWQYVPNRNRKHIGEHDIAVMSLHWQKFLLLCRDKFVDVR